MLAAVAVCAAMLTPLASAGSSAAQQFSLTLEVGNYDPPAAYDIPGQEPRPIKAFRYLVSLDNTGDASDPDSSLHPGVHPLASHSPVVERGEVSGDRARLTLPEGRYLITVVDVPSGAPSTGHKSWGVHVRLPEDAGTTKRVDLIPFPLPLGRIVAHVFQDSNPLNGEPDVPEIAGAKGSPSGLEDFGIVLRDASGAAVTRDYLGNPICTAYDRNGRPVAGSGGRCLTGPDGTAVIPNLPPGKYQVSAAPPTGTDWRQTTTFEGGSAIDARVTEGDAGTGPVTDALPAAVAGPTAYWFGFARRLDFANPANPASRGRRYSGRISGCAASWVRWGPFDTPVINENDPYEGGWVALSMGSAGEQAYAAPLAHTPECPGGQIDIAGVPPGAYTMEIWNELLTSVSREVRLVVPAGPDGSGAAVDLAGDDGRGNVGAFRFFGWLSGHVYNDLNGNGVRDLAATPEPGLAGVPVEIRARDGSVEQSTVTGADGSYEFAQAVSRLSKFEVTEVGFDRFAPTGPSLYSEYTQKQPGDRGVAVPSRLGARRVTAQLITEGHRTRVDWGKRPLGPGATGQIAGVVHYATTRRETDARFARAERYEPGVPGVVVKLWTLGADGVPDTADDVLVDNYQDGRGTDLWEHPSGCDVLDSTGAPVVPRPFLPLGPDCLEFSILGNETKDGTFDGGYVFTDICPPPDGWPCADADRVFLSPGDYVVGIEAPAGYAIVKEEDLNVARPITAAQGDAPACVGDRHLVPAGSASPFKGQTRPLCDKRRVSLAGDQNSRADFFVFTEVPAPGRVFGLLSDDVGVDTDPSSPRFGERRALPDLPIGIRDYSYRLLKTISTDELGFYEALLPSTQGAGCLAASGLCAATYLFVVNDPGDPGRPNSNFDPSYLTDPRTVAVLPGTTTRLETRLDRIAGRPCADYDGPEFFAVDKVALRRSGTAAQHQLTIRGVGFGDERVNPEFPSRPGSVTLVKPGGVPQDLPEEAYASWSDTAIKLTIPDSIGTTPLAPGPYQLLVTAPPTTSGSGRSLTAPTGITLHWLGTGYDPPMRYVDGGSGSDSNRGLEASPFKTIQRAIDASRDGTLIIVEPAVYPENVILYRRVKLQGFGPGGLNGTKFTPIRTNDPRRSVAGTIVNAAFFNSDPALRARWDARLAQIERAGLIGHPDVADKTVPKGAAITVVAKPGVFRRGLGRAQIDGFAVHSARADALGAGGGGIFVNGFGRYLMLSNNLVAGNFGRLGGGIVLGLPYRGPNGNAGSANDNVTIAYNRILGNGGSKYAGGIAIYNGADRYTVSNNDVCSNSAEHGAGLSHYGKSDGGQILENSFSFNVAADAGAGVRVAGQVPIRGAEREGTGAVDLARNFVSSNQSRGDGGGLDLRDAWTSRIGVRNNIVTNNASAGSGGALSLADSSNVRILNNTIVRNTSTSSCWGCLGSGAHAAGLASEVNSPAFQATLPSGSAPFSSPVLLNNIFWENEAFTVDLGTLPLNQGGAPLVSQGFVDFEVVGGPDLTFSPRFSVLSAPYGEADPTNAIFGQGEDPFALAVTSAFDFGFNSKTGEVVVDMLVPLGAGAFDDALPGEYHLCESSAGRGSCTRPTLPIDSGTGGLDAPAGTVAPPLQGPVFAPSIDLDGDERPIDGNGDGTAAIDLGGDELAPEASSR